MPKKDERKAGGRKKPAGKRKPRTATRSTSEKRHPKRHT